DRHDLVGATDPVQMAIKLLIPRGSLLEDHPSITPHLDGYDDAALSWRWDFADPETALLQKELEAIAANASECGQATALTLNEMREAVARASGIALAPFRESSPAPRLTESWYCCAEPTGAQAAALQIGRR
ncbi:MAG TPA: CUAEP/CCAEP-tail radical SAM protein, partial [Acidimicrobiia bacterium]